MNKTTRGLATKSVILAVLLMANLGPRAAGAVDLPGTTGPWKVGHRKLASVDTSRSNRSLPLDVWYPVDAADWEGGPTTIYPLGSGFTLASALAEDNVPVSGAGARPLVVFSHGSGGIAVQSVRLTEQLASHGFVVVAPSHTGNTTNDPAPVSLTQALLDRVPDISFTIDHMTALSATSGDPFFGRIDGTNVGVAGHSLGGFTALAVKSGYQGIPADSRVRAIMPIAPAASFISDAELSGIMVPTLFMTGTQVCEVGGTKNGEPCVTATEIAACTGGGGVCVAGDSLLAQEIRAAGLIHPDPFNYRADVIGATHTHFANICDIANALIAAGVTEDRWPLVGAAALVAPYHATCIPPAFDIDEALRIQNLYATAFFRRHLLGELFYDEFLLAGYAKAHEPAVEFTVTTACGDGIKTAGEECDDGNSDNSDGCTNACTICGNSVVTVVTVPETCDDGNLLNTDSCRANCQNRGQLPPVVYSPIGGPKDGASVLCQKQVGSAISTFRNGKYNLMRSCLEAIQEYKARGIAGASPLLFQLALNVVKRSCDASKPTDPDEKTMLGKIEAARVKAVSNIEKKCGVPGQPALDGKTIGSTASSDFVRLDIEAHVGRAGCAVEEVIAAGYPSAAADLATITTRATQPPGLLKLHFPCLDVADFPSVNYAPVGGSKDGLSVACQKQVGSAVTPYRNKRYSLVRTCIDAIQGHKAQVAAGASAAALQTALDAITRNCIEPNPTAPDAKTMLGKLDAARTKAIADIEKNCGALGSGDFTEAQIAQHIDTVSCSVDSVISAGYAGIKTDLALHNARALRGGNPLDTYFPCIEP